MYNQKQLKTFEDYLRLPTYKQVEVFFGAKLKLYQKIILYIITYWHKANPEMDILGLWRKYL